MLKSTGIKILNVCIQTGVLLSVAYPFFLISIPPPWLPGVKRSSVGELLQCQNRPGAPICAPSAARL